MDLHPGIRGEGSLLVTHDRTAAVVGSGKLAVFATPSMVALMEKTALETVQPYLDAGQGTVGTRIDVSHVAATPEGMTVRAECELTEVDGRRLMFRVAAYCGDELLGEGVHERFIISEQRFMEKVQAKLK